MAMSFETSTQQHISTDIDLDMMSENDHHRDEIDFDIDVEFDAPQDNQDVEVQDAPVDTEHLDSLQYNDEIMYEEDDETFSSLVQEVEMLEENHEADEHMEETVYSGAQSQDDVEHMHRDQPQLADDSSLQVDNATVTEPLYEANQSNSVHADPVRSQSTLATSKYAPVATDTMLNTPGFIEPSVSLDQNEETKLSVVDSDLATVDDGVSEDRQAPSSPQIVTAADVDVSREEVDPASALSQIIPDEETDEINYESDVDEDVPALDNDQVSPVEADVALGPNEEQTAAQGDHESEEQPSTDPDLNTHSENAVYADLEEHAVVSDEDRAELHKDLNHEDFDAFAYNAIVQYEEHSMALFPPNPHVEGLPETFLLQESSLAESPLPDLFQACRTTLANNLSTEDVLCIEFTSLRISLFENDPDCSNVTLSQIIDVYHHLHSNDEEYEPSVICIDLIVRSKPSSRLAQLFKAAEDGKGYVAISSKKSPEEEEEDGTDEDTPDSNEEADDVYFEEWNEENTEDHTEDWNEQSQVEDANFGAQDNEEASINESSLQQAENFQLHESEHSTLTENPELHLEEYDRFQSTGIVVEGSDANIEEVDNGNLLMTAGVQLDVGVDDLIDYSDDDDDDTAQPTRSPTIQPEQSVTEVIPDKVSSENEETEIAAANEDDFIIDFGNADESTAEQHDDDVVHPQITLTDGAAGEGEIATGVENKATVEAEATTHFLELENTDIGNTAESSESHFARHDKDPLEFSESLRFENAVNSDSPTGKRNWDEHVAGSAASAIEQDFKRVRSDG